MNIDASPFGHVDDIELTLYRLENENGLRMAVTDYGATLVSFALPLASGPRDIVLGLDSGADYQSRSPYFGCMVGRVGNRIAGGRFELDDKRYRLATNDGKNHLHGGHRGFDKVVWEVVSAGRTQAGVGLVMRYVSADGEEGYPGSLTTLVEYELTHEDVLVIQVSATSDAATPVNIVHHSYWNLAGHDSGTILDHDLQLHASRYTPVDGALIPLGHLEPVQGTPLDFRVPKSIGRDMERLAPKGMGPGGYDHNFVLDGLDGSFRRAACLMSPAGAVTMEIWTDQPGIQLYTGNSLHDLGGKGGATYLQYGGLCLETQGFPDAIHHRETIGWPDPVIRKGQTYGHRMEHRFRY